MSSAPPADVAVRSGASATASTATVAVPVTVSPSVSVALRDRSKLSSLSAGGVIVTPSSWSGVSVMLPFVTSSVLPSASFKTASAGMSDTVTEVISSVVVPSIAATKFRSIAVSSSPVPPPLTVLVSSRALTVTSKVAVLVADVWMPVSVSVSVETAVMVRLKSSLVSATGVMVNPVRSSALRVQLPSPLSVPALRIAPLGTPAIVTDEILSEPSVSVKAAPISKAIAVSSSPVAACGSSVGASAWAATVTGIVATASSIRD